LSDKIYLFQVLHFDTQDVDSAIDIATKDSHTNTHKFYLRKY